MRRATATPITTATRLASGLALALAAAALAIASPARADVFGPIGLASQGTLPGAAEPQQAEYAHDTAISGDGRYVVFDGSVGGMTGVWRFDRSTGALQQVAGGDAQLPSISENGRYVSFTTNEGRALPEVTSGLGGQAPLRRAGSQQEAVNVYVRDMEAEPARTAAEEAERSGGERAFAVVSAPSGSSEPLTYNAGTAPATEVGATAAGRSAISANGQLVAFVTTTASNLLQGAGGGAETPALQVAVRDLATGETKLVSGEYEPASGRTTETPVTSTEGSETFGAVLPGSRVRFGPVPAYGGNEDDPSLPGASISADGSTVAWMGTDISLQARMLPAETRAPNYTEPLWRRISPGSTTPTERVTGGSDPSNPACVASGEAVLPAKPDPADPCQGPFLTTEAAKPYEGVWSSVQGEEAGERGDFIPRLSADGQVVAFLSRSPLITAGENFGRSKSGQQSDLYVAVMGSGLTRDQALVPVTALAGGEGDRAGNAAIYDFGISQDGKQVAFATRRTQFVLGSPAFVSPPAGEEGLNELFDANLADQTLTRVTHGYLKLEEPAAHPHEQRPSGEDPYKADGDGALSPSFSADGSLLAFSSTASNLVFGDGNTPPAGPLDGSDAFVVGRVTFTPLPTPQVITPFSQPSTGPEWKIGVTAASAKDGSVVLYVDVPGAGRLAASARTPVVVTISSKAHKAKRSRRRIVVTRTVASSAVSLAGEEQPAKLVLRLAKRYAALARQHGGLTATVTVTFVAAGEPSLRQNVVVTFVRAPSKRAKAHRASHAKKGPHR